MSFFDVTCVANTLASMSHRGIIATTSDFSSCIVELPLSLEEFDLLAIFCAVSSALGVLALVV
jgi:hypothetical protein